MKPPALEAEMCRLALLLAFLTAAVAPSCGQPTADGGELVQAGVQSGQDPVQLVLGCVHP